MTLPRDLLTALERGLHAPGSDPVSAGPQDWLGRARRHDWKGQLAGQLALLAPAATSAPRSLDATLTSGLAAARARRLALRSSDDVSTLHAIVRGGTLLEQRAALARLTVLARSSVAPPIDLQELQFDPELERDVLLWLAEGTGAAAREARATLAQVQALLERVEREVRQVVDGLAAVDPIGSLEPQEQAQVLLHLRSASSFLVGYSIDGLLDALERDDVRETSRRLVAWRAAADPRLLPTLANVLLDNPDSAVRAEAARALSRIDDPRVAPTLQLAYQTASAREERIALIEAFGLQGEPRDSEFLRESLEAYQRESALRPTDVGPPPSSRPRDHGQLGLVGALDALFDVELVEAAVRLATHPQAEVQRAAIRAIGRVGEDSALAWLDRIHADVPAGLHGELAAAESSILGRAELRGEKPEFLLDERRRAARERALVRKFSRGLDVPPTKRHRVLAWVLMVRATVARWLGAREAASELCDRAHQADPGWYLPPWFQGRLWWRVGVLPRAIAGYRRALALAPRRLLRHTRWITPILQCFVLRAETLMAQGHGVRAQRLLDELWPHDLSRAASPVRLALRRCRQNLALPAARARGLVAPAWRGDPGPGRDTLERIDGGNENH